MISSKSIKVLIAKPGLDGHDRGGKIVARALRESGMTVTYTGIHQTPEMIVNQALKEDVDILGLSILSGAHNELFPKIVEGLRERGLENVMIIAGGIIPESDRKQIKKIGIKEIFGPGTSSEDIVNFIKNNI